MSYAKRLVQRVGRDVGCRTANTGVAHSRQRQDRERNCATQVATGSGQRCADNRLSVPCSTCGAEPSPHVFSPKRRTNGVGDAKWKKGGAAAAASANKGSDSACAWPTVACSPASVREIVAAARTRGKAGQQRVPVSRGWRGTMELDVVVQTAAAHSNLGLEGRKGQKSDGFFRKGHDAGNNGIS